VGLATARALRRDGFTRHVLFFSIPHAVAHAEAVIRHIGRRSVNQATHDWTDNQIAQVVNDRAGVMGASRRNA
jgi:hypothetical protein